MDPEKGDLRKGHGSSDEHDLVLGRARSALEQRNADALVECAARLFEPHHDDENARRLLLAAAELFPDDGRPLFWLAKIALHRECDDDSAREYLDAALKREPKRPECLSLLVSALIDSDVGRCIELADRLRQHAPDWPDAHIAWAEVMERTGRVSEAATGYSEALRLMERPRPGDLADTYFERVVTGRRAEPVIRNWVLEHSTRRSSLEARSYYYDPDGAGAFSMFREAGPIGDELFAPDWAKRAAESKDER
jgi:hypothetical protein